MLSSPTEVFSASMRIVNFLILIFLLVAYPYTTDYSYHSFAHVGAGNPCSLFGRYTPPACSPSNRCPWARFSVSGARDAPVGNVCCRTYSQLIIPSPDATYSLKYHTSLRGYPHSLSEILRNGDRCGFKRNIRNNRNRPLLISTL